MFLMPVVRLVRLGYGATTHVQHPPTAVLDQERTLQRRELVDAYGASNYFDVLFYVGTKKEQGELTDEG
jgi:ABC-2 type transport system permease protein